MSFSETIFLFLLALIIFGPKKLPEIARMVGKTLNEFRRASNDFKIQIEQEISHLEVEEKKRTILLPSSPPENTASRNMSPVTGEYATDGSAERSAERNDSPPSAESDTAADEPLFATEAAAGATASPHTPPVATEALPASEAVSNSTSQESHA